MLYIVWTINARSQFDNTKYVTTIFKKSTFKLQNKAQEVSVIYNIHISIFEEIKTCNRNEN